jgi:hypothetical protein
VKRPRPFKRNFIALQSARMTFSIQPLVARARTPPA